MDLELQVKNLRSSVEALERHNRVLTDRQALLEVCLLQLAEIQAHSMGNSQAAQTLDQLRNRFEQRREEEKSSPVQ